MERYQPETYGDRIADIYDGMHTRPETSAAVDALSSLAPGGRVLELAVGTGRVAIPLATSGLEVHGHDPHLEPGV